MKEDSKTNPHNQKSMNLTLISQKNQRLNIDDFSKKITKLLKIRTTLTQITILN